MNKEIEKLKDGLIVIYANSCMEALKKQGITIGDGGSMFYEKLTDLIDECLIIGDFK